MASWCTGACHDALLFYLRTDQEPRKALSDQEPRISENSSHAQLCSLESQKPTSEVLLILNVYTIELSLDHPRYSNLLISPVTICGLLQCLHVQHQLAFLELLILVSLLYFSLVVRDLRSHRNQLTETPV